MGYHPGCHGITMSGCQGAIVEDNYFEHFMGCGIYTDTWPMRDIVFQNNIMTDVNQAIFLAADTWDLVNFQIRGNVILLHDGFDMKKIDKGVVATDIPHSQMVGNEIQFRDMKIAGGSVKNGQAVFVTSVPSPTTFTYSTVKGGKSDPADSAAGGYIRAALRLHHADARGHPRVLRQRSPGPPHAQELRHLRQRHPPVQQRRREPDPQHGHPHLRRRKLAGLRQRGLRQRQPLRPGRRLDQESQVLVLCRDNYNSDNTPAEPRDEQGNLVAAGRPEPPH